METKFAPGPWGCKRSEAGPWAIFGQDGSWVATTCKKQWVAEDLANARLIAAAPELLAALQDVIDYIEGKPDMTEPFGVVRAVIAKATGASHE